MEQYKLLRQRDSVGSMKSAWRITVRQLESMLRLSEAMTRMYCSDEVLAPSPSGAVPSPPSRRPTSHVTPVSVRLFNIHILRPTDIRRVVTIYSKMVTSTVLALVLYRRTVNCLPQMGLPW